MGSSPVFHFFSDFAKRRVLDLAGRPLGTIHDIAFNPHESHPRAVTLILREGWPRRRYAAIGWDRVENALLALHLNLARDDVAYSDACPSRDFTIRRDILDKQVVDTGGQKVIRVNDVHLLQVGNELRLSHVDVGIRGIVRRLGWQWWADWFAETFLFRTDYLKDNLINWRYIQPLSINPQKGTLKLTIHQKQLSMIPHADFTEMMLNMDIYQRLALFKTIPADLQPKAFSDFTAALQKELLENMDLQEASTLLAKIPADQATDLLEEIPKSVADSLLAMMETSQARRFAALLGYTSDSAGGLMTTEMITVPQTAAVSEVLDRARRNRDLLESTDHVYLIEGESRLAGQVPLRRLLLAAPADPISRYAYPKPVFVRAKDTLREVAFVMEKYRFSAIPVVNNGKERALQGVITIDDILQRIIPLAWRRRLKKGTP